MGAPIKTGERRPIATRETAFAKRVSSFLVKLGCTPNGISLAGLFAGVAAGVAFALTARFAGYERWFWFAGAALVQCRLLANMFDGMVAIESGKTSPVGELYNEVPDRVSDMGTLAGLGCAAGASPVLGCLAAAMAVFVAYVRAEGKVAGGEQEFCGPMAKPHRMFLVTVLALLNGVLPAGYTSLAVGGRNISLTVVGLVIIIAGCAITAFRRLGRVGVTLRKKDS